MTRNRLPAGACQAAVGSQVGSGVLWGHSGPLGTARDRSGPLGSLGTARDRSGPLGTARDRSASLGGAAGTFAARLRLAGLHARLGGAEVLHGAGHKGDVSASCRSSRRATPTRRPRRSSPTTKMIGADVARDSLNTSDDITGEQGGRLLASYLHSIKDDASNDFLSLGRQGFPADAAGQVPHVLLIGRRRRGCSSKRFCFSLSWSSSPPPPLPPPRRRPTLGPPPGSAAPLGRSWLAQAPRPCRSNFSIGRWDGSGRLGTARDGSGRLGTARDGSGPSGHSGPLGTARDGS